MRRYALFILTLLVMLTPFVLRRSVRNDVDEKPRVAGPRLVVVTPHPQDIRREFGLKFTEWHRKRYGSTVAIDFRTPGATQDIKRLLDITYRGRWDSAGELPGFRPDLHVVWGGGDFFFNELKDLNGHSVLQPLEVSPEFLKAVYPEKTLAGVRLYDQANDSSGREKPPQWAGVCLSAFGIVYSPEVFRRLELPPPRAWRDLTHEKLNASLALADPMHSASAGVAYMMVMQRAMADAEADHFKLHPDVAKRPAAQRQQDAGYMAALAVGWKRGMADLLLIGANARYFTDWSSQVPTDVAHGDAAAGVAIDFYARVTARIVGEDRAKLVIPQGATAITPDPVAILAGVKGEQLELARRFVEFLLSPEGQRLWILKPGVPGGPVGHSLLRPPVRRDVYDDVSGWADDVDPFSASEGFNQRDDLTRLLMFNDLRPVWAAAWIDSREALRQAYDRILAVKDSDRRSKLIGQLADLPIEMSDVAAYREERLAIEQAKGDVDAWRAGKRIEMANRFRAHYASVSRGDWR